MSDIEDTEYQERTVDGVTERPEGWEIDTDGWHFWVPKEHGVTPHVGEVARFYGRGIGYRVRGLALDGHIVWYRSEPEDRRKVEQERAAEDAERRRAFEAHGRAELDAQYATLPSVFRRRIDRFRRNDPGFRWGLEGYEMSCAVDAVRIATWAGTPELVEAFARWKWRDRKATIPGLFDGHSGNSVAFACRLAYEYLTDPELVAREHGALCILNGCDGKCYAPKAMPAGQSPT